MKIHSVIGLAVAATVGAAAALSWALWIWLAFSSAPLEATGQGPVITSEFEPIDQTTGKTVRDDDLGGKWQLALFGFTSCPEICPTTLANVTAAREEQRPAADKLQPLLITVDPERDTAPVLKAGAQAGVVADRAEPGPHRAALAGVPEAGGHDADVGREGGGVLEAGRVAEPGNEAGGGPRPDAVDRGQERAEPFTGSADTRPSGEGATHHG
jgi:hypothetical protein